MKAGLTEKFTALNAYTGKEKRSETYQPLIYLRKLENEEQMKINNKRAEIHEIKNRKSIKKTNKTSD